MYVEIEFAGSGVRKTGTDLFKASQEQESEPEINLSRFIPMHDLGYSVRITQSFRNVLQLGLADGDELLRGVRRLGSDDGLPLLSGCED